MVAAFFYASHFPNGHELDKVTSGFVPSYSMCALKGYAQGTEGLELKKKCITKGHKYISSSSFFTSS